MGYLIKSDVVDALKEDMGNAMMCYEGKERKDIIAFCYESMERIIDEIPQYWPDNMAEDTGLTTPEIMELKERDTAENITKEELNGVKFYSCPICNEPVHEKDSFCCNCGQRLKKEERQ